MQIAISKMNEFGLKKQPFLFIIDYEMQKPIVMKLEQAESYNLFYRIDNQTNYNFNNQIKNEIKITKGPISFEHYKVAFDLIQKHIRRGNSFLVNLTKPTPIEINLNLLEIFECTKAKYQLYFNNQFVTFSPETFVKIESNIISSHPMKGTISAEIPDAENIILQNKKELAEHTTIVDLIRNDLSKVANNVWVERFRYVEKISTDTSDILQVSSEIKGRLPENWASNIGNILFELLPAGSICGAPKPETLKIIKEAEGYDRNYYTGIFGIFDGENLDSGVMIRFIEKTPNGLVFKSGGGITAQSIAENEYNEMIDKVYLPIN
ncbi:MAG: aminodeoxychorismate synthase component I [Bacteroidota bacterium]